MRGCLSHHAPLQRAHTKYHHANTATAGCFSFRYLILICKTFLRESSRETAAGIHERGRNLDLWSFC
jgi:hypothetical protein